MVRGALLVISLRPFGVEGSIEQTPQRRVAMQVHVSWIESGTAVFSFRGTESTQDGLQDLKLIRRNIDFLARSCPGAKAHTGVSLLASPPSLFSPRQAFRSVSDLPGLDSFQCSSGLRHHST